MDCNGAPVFRGCAVEQISKTGEHSVKKNDSVVCISAGMLEPKKLRNPAATAHMYLNYGLLGLASRLEEVGYKPIVVHGHFEAPATFVERLYTRGLLPTRNPVLVSVASSYALAWTRQATRLIRERSPDARIVVGGRWVVADDRAWIAAQLPDANEFVEGLADEKITQIVGGLARRKRVGSSRTRSGGPALNYELLDGWQDFQPSLEVSRGCGMGCSFCAEAREPLGDMKPAQDLAHEFATIAERYSHANVHPYLESSFFRPSTEWVREFGLALDELDIRLDWRTETRADALSPALIRALAGTGLRVLDIGLESASERQLLAMKKSEKPGTYLRRASRLLKACEAAGVWAKVNLLLHPGETEETVQETVSWLDTHRTAIKGVSVGPTILFRFGTATHEILREFEELGASEAFPGALDRDGYSHLNLSSGIDHQRAIELSSQLSANFMKPRDYFDLKSFSYLRRSVTWNQYQAFLPRDA